MIWVTSTGLPSSVLFVLLFLVTWYVLSLLSYSIETVMQDVPRTHSKPLGTFMTKL